MEIIKRPDGTDLALWHGVKSTEAKPGDLEAGIVRGIASTDELDRDSERVMPGAFDKSIPQFKAMGGPLQWAHNGRVPVVGNVEEIKATDYGYPFVARFAVNEPLELGANLAERPHPKMLNFLYGNAIMRSFSVGFLPRWDAVSDKKDHKLPGQHGPTFLEAELLELSCCNVGSNRDALSQLSCVAQTLKAVGLESPPAVERAGGLLFDAIEQDDAADEDAHAATLLEAGAFKSTRVFRGAGSSPDRVIGFKADGTSVLQGYRYPVERFTAEQARQHAKRYGGEFVAFEDASEDVVKQDDTELRNALRVAYQEVNAALASLS